MRLLSVFIMFFTFGYTRAQINLAIKAGVNNTTTTALDGNWLNAQSRFGWQAGLQLEKQLKHWLIYSGINISQVSFYGEEMFYNGYAGVTRRPVFLNMPLGGGYSFHLKQNMSLRLYGGLYGNMGIGGRVQERYKSMYCDPSACPENTPLLQVNRSINYGNNTSNYQQNDMHKANWGLQFGTGLKVRKVMELMVLYNFGLSNIQPGYYDGDVQKLRSLDVHVKIDIATSGHR